jgi:mannose/fructose/N-acetylgalactosamine-specific phosphotransferase system component IID
MSYVAPAIKDKFETLSIDLKNAILERNVELYNIHDLINVLDSIVKEAEEEDRKAMVK